MTSVSNFLGIFMTKGMDPTYSSLSHNVFKIVYSIMTLSSGLRYCQYSVWKQMGAASSQNLRKSPNLRCRLRVLDHELDTMSILNYFLVFEKAHFSTLIIQIQILYNNILYYQ